MDNEKVYLVQTDTTVGFSSSEDEKLSLIKKRPISQKILQTLDSFKTLNAKTRVPKKYKKLIRNSKKTTFIYPDGNSYRVVDSNNSFSSFIRKFKSHYSTSANLTGLKFDEDFAKKQSDVIVYGKFKFQENISSSIFKIIRNKKIKIR